MRSHRRSPAPLWFTLLCVLAVAVVYRLVVAGGTASGGLDGGGDSILLGFWGFFVFLFSAIWTGLQIVGKITLAVLAWSVKLLWVFATRAFNAAKAIGRAFGLFGRAAWNFLEATYDKVLKPIWEHFWKWFDRARRWLEDVLRPVFKFLNKIRDTILAIYKKWVRPILDIIGAFRKVLRVLATFGLDWARALDRKLADLEALIDKPFRLLLAKINEIINIVNRIVTADGLFQRLALIRSIERDVKNILQAWHNSQSKPLTDQERGAAIDGVKYKPGSQVIAETRTYLNTGIGPRAGSLDEWSGTLWRRLGL